MQKAMRPSQLFGTTIALSITPGAVLAVLWATGRLAASPALVGFACCFAAALLIASLWTHDLGKLAETIRQASLENAAGLAAAQAALSAAKAALTKKDMKPSFTPCFFSKPSLN